MGFRSTVFSTFLFVLCDLLCMCLRPSWDGGNTVQTVWLAAHGMCWVLEGVVVFAYFSGTIWFTAGLLGQLLFAVKATIPLWVLHLFCLQMPWTYRKYIADDLHDAWSDGWYATFHILDVIVAIAFYGSLFYTMGCMTEKRMYAPYHKELHQPGAVSGGGRGIGLVGSGSGSGGQQVMTSGGVGRGYASVTMQSAVPPALTHIPSVLHSPTQAPIPLPPQQHQPRLTTPRQNSARRQSAVTWHTEEEAQ